MINRKIIEQVAELAAIDIGSEENLAKQISKIVDYIDQLKEVDIKNVEPLRNPQQHTSEEPLRKDEARKNLPRENIFKNAPLLSENYFKIPKVVK